MGKKIQTTKYKFAQILSFRRPQNIKVEKNPFDSIYKESPISRRAHDFTEIIKMSKKQIYYSDKYTDEEFEYRHVMLPKDLAKMVPKTHLMSETEWRNLGVQQSQGWVHYMTHDPEPHILLFRRPTAIYGANQNQNQAPNQQN